MMSEGVYESIGLVYIWEQQSGLGRVHWGVCVLFHLILNSMNRNDSE